MKAILDTHAWLWWISQPQRVGKEASGILRDPANMLFLSAASTWEISIKYRLGKVSLPTPPEEFVLTRIKRDHLTELPVRAHHTLRVASLPDHHRDPFDRLLIAQSQIEGIPVLSSDPLLKPYGIPIIAAGE